VCARTGVGVKVLQEGESQESMKEKKPPARDGTRNLLHRDTDLDEGVQRGGQIPICLVAAALSRGKRE